MGAADFKEEGVFGKKGNKENQRLKGCQPWKGEA